MKFRSLIMCAAALAAFCANGQEMTAEWHQLKNLSWGKARNDFPRSAEPGYFKTRMLEIDEWAKANDTDLYFDYNKPYRIAQMVEAEFARANRELLAEQAHARELAAKEEAANKAAASAKEIAARVMKAAESRRLIEDRIHETVPPLAAFGVILVFLSPYALKRWKGQDRWDQMVLSGKKITKLHGWPTWGLILPTWLLWTTFDQSFIKLKPGAPASENLHHCIYRESRFWGWAVREHRALFDQRNAFMPCEYWDENNLKRPVPPKAYRSGRSEFYPNRNR